MIEIARGAEAVIYKIDDLIIKRRVKKNYRISEIDESLTKFRTRREAKIIKKIPVPAPKLISVDETTNEIHMSYVPGVKFRDCFDVHYCERIGEHLALMHNNNIIHGDLTTSNMILNDGEIFFIDFGLSIISQKIEDKSVDIHLLKQAIESKHHLDYENAIKSFLIGYKKVSVNFDEILIRLKEVESRGRNKGKF